MIEIFLFLIFLVFVTFAVEVLHHCKQVLLVDEPFVAGVDYFEHYLEIIGNLETFSDVNRLKEVFLEHFSVFGKRHLEQISKVHVFDNSENLVSYGFGVDFLEYQVELLF